MFSNSRSTSPHVRRSPTQERSRRTVAAVLDAAARVFGELGYRATTTNDIARAAGVSVGSLYQYFPNKDALLVGLYEQHLDTAAAAMRPAVSASVQVSPAEWVNAVVAALVAVNDGDLAPVLYDATPALPQLQERTREIVERLTRAATRHFRRWGVAQPASRAELAVVTAVALVHEVVLRRPRGRGRTAAARQVAELLEAGIVAAVRP